LIYNTLVATQTVIFFSATPAPNDASIAKRKIIAKIPAPIYKSFLTNAINAFNPVRFPAQSGARTNTHAGDFP
jgi:hypothetical protein